MTYYWQFTQSRSKCHRDPLQNQEGMLSLRSYLVDENVAVDGRAGISADGEGLVDSWCRYTMNSGGREEAKGQRKVFMFKFFLSCHKIWILFHTIKN